MPKKQPDPIDVHVGSRLRGRRQAVGLSQSKLAAGLGLTFQQVQKYENGANRMGASRLAQVASILKVPVGHFYEGGPSQSKIRSDAPSAEYITEFFASAEGAALAKAFGKIKPKSVRRHIVSLVVALAGG